MVAIRKVVCVPSLSKWGRAKRFFSWFPASVPPGTPLSPLYFSLSGVLWHDSQSLEKEREERVNIYGEPSRWPHEVLTGI